MPVLAKENGPILALEKTLECCAPRFEASDAAPVGVSVACPEVEGEERGSEEAGRDREAESPTADVCSTVEEVISSATVVSKRILKVQS